MSDWVDIQSDDGWEDVPATGPSREVAAPVTQEEPSLLSEAGDMALEAVGAVGQFMDKYTGAPTRSYLATRQAGGGVIDAAKAFGEQFGDDTNKAPTGKDIVRAEGISDTALSDKLPGLYSETGEGWRLKRGGALDPTASGAAGLVVDIAADPTNLIPGKYLAAAVGKTAGVAAKGATKVASALSGVPEQVIKTYGKHMPAVNSAIAKYGDDIASAADATRDGYNAAIKQSRRGLNQQISEALISKGDKTINIDLVARSLNDSKLRLNPALHAGEIAEIDELIKMTDSVRGAHGNATLKDFFDLQEILRERAKGAYQKSGQIFTPGSRSQNAAKQASAIARKSINEASPEIAQANNRLALMHNLEDRMNKNLIGSGRPEGALISVGSGTNKRGAKQLGRLGELTNTDMVKDAEVLAAQKMFAKPDLIPVDQTGKSLTRTAVSYGLGKLSGIPGAEIALPAAMSPAAIKTGMRIGSPVVKGIEKAGRYGYVSTSAVGRQQNNEDRSPGLSPDGVLTKLRSKPGGEKYIGIIESAAQRGPDSFGSTYFLKFHSDPEFQKLMGE